MKRSRPSASVAEHLANSWRVLDLWAQADEYAAMLTGEATQGSKSKVN
jgi:hypothetical protein